MSEKLFGDDTDYDFSLEAEDIEENSDHNSSFLKENKKFNNGLSILGSKIFEKKEQLGEEMDYNEDDQLSLLDQSIDKMKKRIKEYFAEKEEPEIDISKKMVWSKDKSDKAYFLSEKKLFGNINIFLGGKSDFENFE